MIKLFKQYNDYNKVKTWLDYMDIENYTINDDLTVDVDGDVIITNMELCELPIKFGRVNGVFDCSKNQLISLNGCPKEVGSYFDCSYNKLTSLDGCPKEVGGYFFCSFNHLTSLIGGPKEVGGYFSCNYNQLTSLNGCPMEIAGNFYCMNNKLTSLDGSPKEVGGIFSCSSNPLPNVISNLDNDTLKTLLKYQEEYGIWNNDGSLNRARFNIFLNDFNIGILT